ncbi:SoxR reducing system RseC family protein [Clostridium saccharoperbutylacetonicum]|uniref:SoxR reducing system RseC family protein n=1 Tax=Clostridium saccharoperbutylacetonicum TaxID=36745 RepID=UPI0039ECF2C2
MKTEQGLVIEVDNDIAKIRVGRHSDCKNCGACPGDNSIIISANNTVGAKPGQRVAFEMKDVNVLRAAFVVFIFPLIAAFIGVLLGMFIGDYLQQDGFYYEIFGGIITFALSLVFVKAFDKVEKASAKSQPVIIEIL